MGLIWLYLAPFTPSCDAENEARVVSLALRSLVRTGPAWPRCGLGWPRCSSRTGQRTRGFRRRGKDGGVLLGFRSFSSLSHLCCAHSPGMIRSGLPPYSGPIWPDLARFTSNRHLCAKPVGILGVERPSGVRRSGKLLISAHFQSFPLVGVAPYNRDSGIPLVDADGGRLGLRLRLHPHPHILPSREKGPAGAWMRGSRLRGNDGNVSHE